MVDLVERSVEQESILSQVSIEDVNRVLEVGRILLSVLTPDEVEQLRQVLSDSQIHESLFTDEIEGISKR